METGVSIIYTMQFSFGLLLQIMPSFLCGLPYF